MNYFELLTFKENFPESRILRISPSEQKSFSCKRISKTNGPKDGVFVPPQSDYFVIDVGEVFYVFEDDSVVILEKKNILSL